ncbi:MAG: DUF4214 domain-containing protein [Bdellovibrionaceae bacterium]|nr:DUF4214 domain-containing protein [Pseudobdellovibrionaceae bacterium]
MREFRFKAFLPYAAAVVVLVVAFENCSGGLHSQASRDFTAASLPAPRLESGGIVQAQASAVLNDSLQALLNGASRTCAELKALDGKDQNASPVLQDCLNRAVGGTLLIPAGVYRLRERVVVQGPIAVASENSGLGSGAFVQCGLKDARCARFIAANDQDFSQPQDKRSGLFHMKGDDILWESLIMDGDRQNRLDSPVLQSCRAANNAAGHLLTVAADRVTIRGSVFANAVCGSALNLQNSPRTEAVVLEANIFAFNGRNDDQGAWSDGLTVGEGANLKVVGNLFEDNTDVQLIMGGCRHCTIDGNTFRHGGDLAQGAFGELHLQNWPGGTSGDFTGTTVTGNHIDCRYRCSMGLALGANSWYPSAQGAAFGAVVTGNIVTRALIAYNVDVITGHTILENNKVLEAALGTAGECDGQPIRLSAINLTDDSKGLLSDTSRTWMSAYGKALPDAELITNKDYPYCIPSVSRARIDKTYDLSAIEADFTATFTAQIKRAYREILGREVDDAGLQFHLKNMKAGQGLSEVRESLAASKEGKAAIDLIYRTVLDRAADVAGASYAVQFLKAGGDLDVYRRDLALSAEAADKITAAFRAVLSRAPTAAEIKAYQQKLVATHSWAQVRQEIDALKKTDPVPEPVIAANLKDFLTHLYQTTFSRSADKAGLNAWAEQYERNQTSCRGLTLAFLRSSENTYRQQALNSGATGRRSYVRQLYPIVFWRTADAAGVDYWTGLLSQGAVSLDNLEMELLNSDEFKGVCSSRDLRY